MKRHSVLLVAGLMLAVVSGAAAQQAADSTQVSPRITRFEAWLNAIATHRPGALDDSVRLVSTWNQEQLRLIWIDALTITSLVREPGVSLFYVRESIVVNPRQRDSPVAPGARQPTPVQPGRSQQVLYGVAELRRMRAIAKRMSPDPDMPGAENEMLKRGAMLHADIEILVPKRARASANPDRPGPGGVTLFMNDGQQLGLSNNVSHWDMGGRLLDRIRPTDSKNGLSTRPDPGADETVRRWYLAAASHMLSIRFVEPSLFIRALELFPKDPQVLFFVASVHEYFAGVRMQSVMQALKAPRDVWFGILEQGEELRLAEQLYRRALERDPMLLEARIRLGRVLGLRGRHKEAVEQLRQGQSASEPLLQFYAQLFLGGEYEALGNGAEARQSYERAAALQPTAQSPLFGLSRVADQAGDRQAARELMARMFALPPDEERADPWWVYELVQARTVDALIDDLRQRIAALPK